ncbi:unnamed protein product, partial [Darwinula stevensoni]
MGPYAIKELKFRKGKDAQVSDQSGSDCFSSAFLSQGFQSWVKDVRPRRDATRRMRNAPGRRASARRAFSKTGRNAVPTISVISLVLDENPETGEGGLGDPCDGDEDCNEDQNLACNLSLMKCDCADGYVFDTDILMCVTGGGGLGDPCSNDSDCNGNLHYHCDEEAQICTCADDYELDLETLLCGEF